MFRGGPLQDPLAKVDTLTRGHSVGSKMAHGAWACHTYLMVDIPGTWA
jgi:hypothetical protein